GQLGRSDTAPPKSTTEARRHGEGAKDDGQGVSVAVAEIAEKVVTAEVLQAAVDRARAVLVQAKAIITPAAQDIAKQLGVEIRRAKKNHEIHGKTRKAGDGAGAATGPVSAQTSAIDASTAQLLIVVQNTAAIDHLWDQLRGTWRREFLGCPDDAAKLAIGE